MAWRANAKCLDHPTRYWFPKPDSPPEETRIAVSLCRTCPVREQCAKLPAEYGIFGGRLRGLDFEA